MSQLCGVTLSPGVSLTFLGAVARYLRRDKRRCAKSEGCRRARARCKRTERVSPHLVLPMICFMAAGCRWRAAEVGRLSRSCRLRHCSVCDGKAPSTCGAPKRNDTHTVPHHAQLTLGCSEGVYIYQMAAPPGAIQQNKAYCNIQSTSDFPDPQGTAKTSGKSGSPEKRMHVKTHLFGRYFSLTERVTAGVQDSHSNSANASFRWL